MEILGKFVLLVAFSKDFNGKLFREPNNRIYPLYSKQKGVAVIINNQEFTDKELYPFRTGADVDANNLEKLFLQLGFKVQDSFN